MDPINLLRVITHVPTQGGMVNPATAVGKIARKHGVLYLLDACQSVGQIDVNVVEVGCDILSCTGRKLLRGPRGTGFLYVRRSVIDQIDPPFVDLFSAKWTEASRFEFAGGAKRFENWESFVAGRVGLMEAVRYARNIGLANIESRVTELAQDLRDALSEVKGVSVHDLGRKKCGIVTFTKDGIEPKTLAENLRAEKIYLSVSPVTCARLDLEPRNLLALTRASVQYFNTHDEILRFVEAVKQA